MVARFDFRNPRAETWIATKSSTLIRDITAEQVGNVRLFLHENMRDGVNPQSVAYNLAGRINRTTGRREGGIIGLTKNQTIFADELRRDLMEGNPDRMDRYLGYKLRNDSFDEIIEAVLKNKRGLSASEASKIVGHYNDNVVMRRGQTIARTELLEGMSWAQYEGLRQLVERGVLQADDITLTWDAANDGDTRPAHRFMDGQKRKFGDPFVSGTGSLLLHPLDRTHGAGADDCVNCRCNLRVKINHLKIWKRNRRAA